MKQAVRTGLFLAALFVAGCAARRDSVGDEISPAPSAPSAPTTDAHHVATYKRVHVDRGDRDDTIVQYKKGKKKPGKQGGSSTSNLGGAGPRIVFLQAHGGRFSPGRDDSSNGRSSIIDE